MTRVYKKYVRSAEAIAKDNARRRTKYRTNHEFRQKRLENAKLHKEHRSKIRKARYIVIREEFLRQRREEKRANPEKYKAIRHQYWLKHRGNRLINGVRKFCKTKGIVCDLTTEWANEKIYAVGRCEMSGLPFDLVAKRGPESPSIDRIDPNGPYTKSNCRIIFWFLNRALSNLGDDYACMIFEHVLARRRWTQTSIAAE